MPTTAPADATKKKEMAREVIDVLEEISILLVRYPERNFSKSY